MTPLERLARAAVRSTVGIRVSAWLDHALARTVRSPGGGPDVVVVPTPGGGNVGDSALARSTLRTLSGRSVVVVGRADDYETDPIDRPRFTGRSAPVYGHGPAHWRAVRDFARLLREARAVVVIGADVMDGGYSVTASARRWWCVDLAARRGLDARVISASWSTRPHPNVVAAARAATRRGVRIHARDPRSHERLTALVGDAAVNVADIAFVLDAPDRPPPTSASRGCGQIVVNASGLIRRDSDLVPHYVRLVDGLMAYGYHVVLLPHVVRRDGDDLDVLRDVAVATGAELWDRLPTIAEVQALTADAHLVVTGRMHLSVLALAQGTPALVLSTQGKVEGLMDLIGCPDAAVEPAAFGARVDGLLEDPAGWIAAAAVRVAARRDAVVELACRNLADLA